MTGSGHGLDIFLKPHDIVVTETGTSSFGILETKFPKGVAALNQVLWGSIGYSVGATQGAALAARDAGENRRTILFVGDGSFQLSAQEVSTIIRHGLRVTIFLICNDGYTIERYIHGMDETYNDVQPWHYKDLVAVFSAIPEKSKVLQIKTKTQLNDLLSDKAFAEFEGIQFVEVYIPKKDAPRVLKMTSEYAAKNIGQ